MARKPRIHFPGALYHVIARGNQKQKIFLDVQDYKTYLSYLSEYKTKYDFQLYAYALMKNHVHLLVEVQQTPLSKIMQVVQFRYTKYFNKQYKKVGHLFQGRFKAILCDKDQYLLELVRYIHLNPVRAKIVDDPQKYSWTSHSIYLGDEQSKIVDKKFVLSQFCKNKKKAQWEYRQFISSAINSGHQNKFYQVKDQTFLGEDEFVDQIEVEKHNYDPIIFDIPIEEIVFEVLQAIGIKREDMYSSSRNRNGAYGRGLVGYLAKKLSGYMIKDIGIHFKREPMTISQAITKEERRIIHNKDEKKIVEHLEKKLLSGRRKKYLITNA